MKITICGSIAFFDKMLEIKEALEKLSHEVQIPPVIEIRDENGEMIHVEEYYKRRKAEISEEGWIWDRKEEAIRMHLDKIDWSVAILVLNYDKNNISNYIGGNTLLEVGVAFFRNKKIFFINRIPEISYKEELLGMKPIIIDNDLNLIQ